MQKQKISKDTSLGKVASEFPAAIPVLLRYGLHCIGCHVAAWETIEQGCRGHGMDDKQIDEMIKEINTAIEKNK